MSSDLDLAGIQRGLTTKRYGRSVDLRNITDSTNDDARHAGAQGAADGHLVLAEQQRAGRGSKGRSWSSPAGQDLYLSILDRPASTLAAMPPLTLAVGLGVAQAVDGVLGPAEGHSGAQVKWPNDVWLGGKKCAGILVEAASMGEQLQSLVIGIGLNVNRQQFGAELEAQATSLSLATGKTLDRTHVLQQLLAQVEAWVDRFVAEGSAPVVAAMGERLALVGEQVRCGGVMGRLQGVADSGALLIEDDARRLHHVVAGTLMRA